MKREVTTKLKLETMQQLLVLKEQLLSSKDDQINFQIFTIKEKDKVINQKENEIQQSKTENENQQLKILSLEERLSTQINYRFGTHSEKSFEQLSFSVGSEDGARSTCLLFSLIECAIINDINPEEYLSSIFELAADTTDWTDSKWSELLPWNIKLIKRSDVSTVLIA